jgi:hypothetical protein
MAEGRMLSELKARSRSFHVQGAYRCLGWNCLADSKYSIVFER